MITITVSFVSVALYKVSPTSSEEHKNPIPCLISHSVLLYGVLHSCFLGHLCSSTRPFRPLVRILKSIYLLTSYGIPRLQGLKGPKTCALDRTTPRHCNSTHTRQ